MIGFFDSGFGGIQTLKYFKQLYPEYDYLFLADAKNCPYGPRSGEEIQELTFKALHRLFDHGAKIVILACNTAAAYSVRKWQTLYPEKKVLSITIPGIEEVLAKDDIKGKVGVLATQATINSNIYNDLFARFGGDFDPEFHFVMAPELVDLVEDGFEDEEKSLKLVEKYVQKFPSTIKYLILGCTHFPVLMKHFKKVFDGQIIDPSWEAAKKFGPYLQSHTEISNKLLKKGTMQFFTTGEAGHFESIASKILGKRISAKNVKY